LLPENSSEQESRSQEETEGLTTGISFAHFFLGVGNEEALLVALRYLEGIEGLL